VYHGGVGMLTWTVRRLTGVAVLLFLCLHIIETSMLRFGPRAYESAIGIYKQLWFKPIEFLLVAAVIYHAGDGILVMILDAWPGGTRAYRTLVWTAAVLYAALIIPLGLWMMRRLLGF